MVDLEKHYGRDHKYVNYDDFRPCSKRQGGGRAGDMLLLHTASPTKS